MELDFSKLKFDISKVPDDVLVKDYFPELGDHKEFQSEYENEVLKWVILTVDDGSPFCKLYRDFTDRSVATYNYLEMDNKNLLNHIQGTTKKNDFTININSKIFKFFTILGKHNYTAWYSTWRNFQELNAFLQISLDVLDDGYVQKFDKKQSLSAKLPALQKTLAQYEIAIFGDTEIKDIVTDQVSKLIQWPEKMAKVYPYKDGYKKDSGNFKKKNGFKQII